MSEAGAIVARLTDWWKVRLLELPDGEFARPKLGRPGHMPAKAWDRAIRIGLVERLGFVRDGEWQYRLTALGTSVKAEIDAGRAA